MRSRTTNALFVALLLACAQQSAPAQSGKKALIPPDPAADAQFRAAGFLESHPDIRYRLLGLEEFRNNNHADALRFFKRASFYADKPSQGMVAEMYWSGQGVEKDPVIAYAWMDLAAERGYEGFRGLRERYWKSLSAEERQQALVQGEAIYATYGDAAAKPRLATVLRRERKKVTGSRTGFAGSLKIYVPGPSGSEQIDGSKFYDERFWDVEKYYTWHDSIWMKPRIGKVSVGNIDQVDAASPAPASRIPATAPNTSAPEPETPTRDETELGTREQD
ncbi:hypothetical protein [Pseudoxanthomonas sp.]|uniref:hypothetical protein n=1 Tax=Pseudoxanthomonas sp. TaxID=1871049 RepID=UPI002FDFE5F1